MGLTVEQLKEFEQEIYGIYETGIIRGPIHLRDGCESKLISIFESIKPTDYVLSTWGSHLHALLHGVPRELVKKHILDGKSITLCFPEYKFYSSAIVGGITPIAAGLGLSMKLQNKPDRVWAFIGDMTYFTGIAQESIRYCTNWNLPVTFVVEDNGKSVGTPTLSAWNQSAKEEICPHLGINEIFKSPHVWCYSYPLGYPHSGIGKFISF